MANNEPANIEPEELPNGNNTLSFTIITLLVSLIISLLILLIQVNHEKEVVPCQSILPINVTLIRQLEKENEYYARQHNSCIDSLQSSENQITKLEIENRQHESEKQKNEKNQEETEKKLDIAEKKLNLLKMDNKALESEKKKYKNDFEKTQKKLQLAAEKVDTFDKNESEVSKELIELKKQLKDIKNEKIELKSNYEAAQEELKSQKSSRSFNIFLFVSKLVFIYSLVFNIPIDTHNPKKALKEIFKHLILLEAISHSETFVYLWIAFVFLMWFLKLKGYLK